MLSVQERNRLLIFALSGSLAIGGFAGPAEAGRIRSTIIKIGAAVVIRQGAKVAARRSVEYVARVARECVAITAGQIVQGQITESVISLLTDTYLQDLQSVTGRSLHPSQTDYAHGEFQKPAGIMDPNARSDFNRGRSQLIKDHGSMTGNLWPQQEYTGSNPGQITKNYDAHHINPLKNGGSPLDPRNIHPAQNPIEHQRSIHGKDGALTKLLNCMKNRDKQRMVGR